MPQAVFCKKINFRKVIGMKIKSISKHVLAIVLSLAVLASAMMLNTFSVFAEADTGTASPQIWSGTAYPTDLTGKDLWDHSKMGNVFDGGTGSSTEPYLISDPEQLAYVCQFAGWYIENKYFKLTADIYLNDVSNPDWMSSAKQWILSEDNNGFRNAHLDGDGHTIYGLYMNKENGYCGLIYKVTGSSSVENLRIAKSYIRNARNNNYVTSSALVGFVHNNATMTVNNCVIDDDVQVVARSGMAGGFIGFADTGSTVTINNCYSGAKLTQEATWFSSSCYVRAFASARSDTKAAAITISNSYTTSDRDLAFVSSSTAGTFTNCYTTYADTTEKDVTVRTLAEMTGAKARVYMNAFDFNNVWYTEAGKTPQLRALVETVPTEDTKLWNVWDGTVPETVTYDGGDGKSAATAYEISTAEQLAYLVSKGSGGYYKLTDDIYLNDVSDSEWYNNTQNEWSAVVGANTNFSGTVDGNGHTIYGLYINSNLYFTGLIPRFVGGTISNLRISKSYVKNTGYDGGHGVLVGQIWQNRNVRNCVIDETVEFITAGYGSPLIGGLNDDGANLTGTVNVEGCYVAAKMSTIHADTKPAAFFGKPITAKGITYSSTASHLVIENSYYSGEYALAAEKEDGPVIYDGCYTTKELDTVPTGVTAGATLEVMNTAGLSTVLKEFPKLGNVNGDDAASVDICDLVTLKKLELGMAVVLDIYGSDVNNDREINGLDYLALQKYILNDLSVFQ